MLKKIIILCTLILQCAMLPVSKSIAQPQPKIYAQVDKRIETLSIVARLAGYEEYNDSFAKKYIEHIYHYFDSYKNDTLIGFMKHLRRNIGYDAVMAMATNLELKRNRFSFIDSWKKDLRWNHTDAVQFVSLLNSFYKKTNFENFFKKEARYYAMVIKAFDSTMLHFNQLWYYEYYGTPPREKFNIIISCGNGGQNYGSTTNSIRHGKQTYAIIGSAAFDQKGDPIFPKNNYLPLIVHEFNHAFVNPLLNEYENADILKKSATILFGSVKTKMAANNYSNWQTMINESIVRASVVRYLMTNNSSIQTINSEIAEQFNRGFLWTKSLVDLLDIYENNRSIYPTLKDFYPRIIYFFDTTTKYYESKLSTVISLEPFANKARDVDPNLKEMTIYFDQPMNTKYYSFNFGELGENAWPMTKVIGYSDDKKSIKVSLNLKPDTEYEMMVTGLSFVNIEGYPLKDYLIKFKTRRQ